MCIAASITTVCVVSRYSKIHFISAQQHFAVVNSYLLYMRYICVSRKSLWCPCVWFGQQNICQYTCGLVPRNFRYLLRERRFSVLRKLAFAIVDAYTRIYFLWSGFSAFSIYLFVSHTYAWRKVKVRFNKLLIYKI